MKRAIVLLLAALLVAVPLFCHAEAASGSVLVLQLDSFDTGYAAEAVLTSQADYTLYNVSLAVTGLMQAGAELCAPTLQTEDEVQTETLPGGGLTIAELAPGQTVRFTCTWTPGQTLLTGEPVWAGAQAQTQVNMQAVCAAGSVFFPGEKQASALFPESPARQYVLYLGIAAGALALCCLVIFLFRAGKKAST